MIKRDIRFRLLVVLFILSVLFYDTHVFDLFVILSSSTSMVLLPQFTPNATEQLSMQPAIRSEARHSCCTGTSECWSRVQTDAQKFLSAQTFIDNGWSYRVAKPSVGMCTQPRDAWYAFNESAFTEARFYGSLAECIPHLRQHTEYDYPLCDHNKKPLLIHTIWTTDHPPHAQLLLLVRSALVTHINSHTPAVVTVWLYQSNPTSPTYAQWMKTTRYTNLEWARLLRRPDVVIKNANMLQLSHGTPLQEWMHNLTAGTGYIEDARHWIDSDIMRLLLLYNHGGVYLDADVVVLRSFATLTLHEWIYQWGTECMQMNGALMHFHAKSSYMEDALRVIVETQPADINRVGGFTTFGTDLYGLIWSWNTDRSKKLVPQVLPSCFLNPSWHGTDTKFEPENWSAQWNGPFAFHVHGTVWGSSIHPNSDYAFIRDLMAKEMDLLM